MTVMQRFHARRALRSVTLPGIFLLVATAVAVSPARAQDRPAEQLQSPEPVMGANWTLGARWAPYKIRKLVYSTSVSPHWIKHGDRFWYEWKTSAGTFYYVVDPARASKRQIFDNDRIAAELTRITHDPWDAQHLPIKNIRFIDQNTLQFDVQSSQDEKEDTVETEENQQQRMERERRAQARKRARKKVFHFEYDVPTRTLRLLEPYEAPDNHPGWATMSPDSAWVVYSKQCNLYAMDAGEYAKVLDARRGKSGAVADSADAKLSLTETQLTTDGEKWYCYGSYGRGKTDDETAKNWDKRHFAGVLWSHDSRYFGLTRQDRRKVGELWVIHSVDNKRPQLETYKYDLPGEKNVTQTELLVYDMQARQMKRIDDDPWTDERMGVFAEPRPGARRFFRGPRPPQEEPPIRKWLSPDPNQLYFWRRSRDQHRVDVLVADPATGDVRVVIEERMNTYVEHQTPRRLKNGDLIWWSERDGWAHLYRYGEDGTLKGRLTEGPWHVSQVVGVDEKRGRLFFTANAREKGEDPYYNHTYRVNLDGSGLALLDGGDFDHRPAMSESSRYFVDNFSRVNTVPRAVLFDGSGAKVLDLEESDFSSLEAAGYRFPEPYRVKAADGVTDLYGVMYKPFDFDPHKRYPIVEYVYPGPQTEAVPKSFSTSPSQVGLAQLGFIVVVAGNRGGHPNRSKWYHNYGYGNLRDYGLADKKAVIEQLADRFDFIDIHRVGIWGHSGGGFMSTAAMLVYPDFFKVAVSESGNHNNDVYNQNWSEKHHGVKEVVGDSGKVSFKYSIEKNSDLAQNLKGHLLLSMGDVDNNVHPAGTLRMAEALIKANKRFDFIILPGQRHGYGKMSDYFFWRRNEYFAKYLLGDERTAPDIVELDMEREQTGGR